MRVYFCNLELSIAGVSSTLHTITPIALFDTLHAGIFINAACFQCDVKRWKCPTENGK